ncbi:MAG: hypothetical protein AAF602_29855, partial [Myxococcota bacterium]
QLRCCQTRGSTPAFFQASRTAPRWGFRRLPGQSSTCVWQQRSCHAFRKGHATGLLDAGAHYAAVEYLHGRSLGVAGIYTDPRALPLAEAVALVPPLGHQAEASPFQVVQAAE